MKRILLVLALFAGMTLGIPSVARPGLVEAFTEQVSPEAETNATEPSVAVDRSDGTVWVAWQASGTHVARSDDGGRSFAQTPIVNLFGNDIGDVDIAVGGPTPCAVPTTSCLPGTRRVYVTSLERLPLLLQTHLAYSDDRGAHWTINDVAAVNPSFIDRPWLAVYPSKVSANQDSVYISYHDFTASQIWVASSHAGGQVFDGGPPTNTDAIFATLGVDDSGKPGVGGNVYSVFTDNLLGPSVFDVWFSHSSDKAQTWSYPVKVNSDKGTHYFPWIAAGSTGRVDFIWLDSPDYTPSDAE